MRASRFRNVAVAVAALGGSLALPASAFAGHGLESLDHPYPAFSPPASPPSSEINSGGKGATWDLVGTVATGNPHTDLDFFTQNGETFASVGTLGIGPNGGGQTIVQLTEGDEVAPSFVTGHPSAACLSDPSAALGLQHDVEATPKGSGIPLNTKNPFAPQEDAQLLVDATDAAGRCHDQGDVGIAGAPQGGLELIDISNLEAPVEIGLTSHIGEAHTVNIDPKRPHIAYVSSSDRITVKPNGNRANEDPEGEPNSLDGIEVVDMSSCMNLPPSMSTEERRQACRPEVYRYRWPTKKYSLGHTLRNQVWGCHELEIYPSDLLTCGAGSGLITLDMSGAFRDMGTPTDFTDDVPRGDELPCRRRGSTSIGPFATGAKVVDCVDGMGMGTTDLTVPEWLDDGAPSLKGVKWYGTVRHQGRGSGGAATPTYNSKQDIDFNHEAELTPSGRFLIASDERGGGVVPPGASCSPEADNKAGNGGLHAYQFPKVKRKLGGPRKSFRAYARDPKGKKAIYRIPIRTGPQGSLCTAHVFQIIPGQNRIFMGWYSQGTLVLDFKERRSGRLRFRQAGYLIPENANTWVSHIFDYEKNPDGTFTYRGATGDFNLGAAGRSAIDVYETTLPAPPKPRRIEDSACEREHWGALMNKRGVPFTSEADCRSYAR
ncbi:MAG: hypothetical protein WKF62_05735 [Solirubrobacterales bacterium]